MSWTGGSARCAAACPAISAISQMRKALPRTGPS
jgi:hypothetical protein